MFTGLIEETGVVEKLNRHSKVLGLSIKKPSSFNDVKIGDSISVNGACLTVKDLPEDIMVFDVMQESLERTNLKNLRKGDKVNLERALKMGERLDGHFVTGHIDYKTQIEGAHIKPDATKLEIGIPERHRRYIVSKGSIAVDGVSLTVGEVFKDRFSVYLIPYTLKKTTLGLKRKGEFVNVEIDILTKLVLSSVSKKESSIDIDFLKEHGFLE